MNNIVGVEPLKETFTCINKWFEGFRVTKDCDLLRNHEGPCNWIDRLKSAPPIDLVNHPPHYTQGRFEVIEVIEDWKLNYKLACVIKYIARCDFKNDPLQDLKKARWYLDREIVQREREKND